MLRGPRSPILASFGLALGLSLGLTFGLAGCASGGMLDQLPSGIGGEPADLPPKPKTPYKYPAVHDMPPPRATKPLTDNEQIKLEKDLEAARDRLENKYGTAPKPAPASKKKPASRNGGQGTNSNAAGANASGAKTNP